MAAPVNNDNQEQIQEAQQKNDKEYNFAQIRKQLESERIARQQAEQKAAEYERLMQERQKAPAYDEDDDDEPYVDQKKLKRILSKRDEDIEQKIERKAEEKARRLLEMEKQEQWLRANPDFQEVMDHAQKLYEKDPELGETILKMPDNFERHKLVYKNIKALGLHRKEEPKPSISEMVERNRRSPYYQPSGIAAAPYQSHGDFSPSGQQSAYQKMKELQSKLRL